MDRIEEILKKHFRRGSLRSQDRDLFPCEEEFALYCQDELKGEALERMQRSLALSHELQEMVLEAKRLMSEEPEEKDIPRGLMDTAKRLMKQTQPAAPCPHCGKKITPFKNPPGRQAWVNFLWLFLMIGSFALSFVFHRYFMQFLAVTMLAGFKWVVEMRASKTQIMIYRALSSEHEHKNLTHRLRSFQEKED